MKLLILALSLITLGQSSAYAGAENSGSSGTRGGIMDTVTTAAFYPEITKEALDKAVAINKEIPIQKDSLSGEYVISSQYLDSNTSASTETYYTIPDSILQDYPHRDEFILRN